MIWLLKATSTSVSLYFYLLSSSLLWHGTSLLAKVPLLPYFLNTPSQAVIPSFLLVMIMMNYDYNTRYDWIFNSQRSYNYFAKFGHILILSPDNYVSPMACQLIFPFIPQDKLQPLRMTLSMIYVVFTEE